ncbi:divergent polysaccharide deacetylase family protein [Sulfurimonas sp.]|uniref:divergent polysaccharide deacetylase family protein n=1 Tax=Sulfurimonas sp. TaxID=2022749 RepID=UPI0039E322DE
MSKSKKSQAKNDSNILKYIAWLLGILILALVVLAGGYYMGFENAKSELQEKESEKRERRLALLKKIEQTNVPTVDNMNDRLKKVLKDNIKVKKEIKETFVAKEKQLSKISKTLNKEILKVREYAGASHEYASDSTQKAPSRIKREVKVLNSNKPKLAIIIDDVSVRSQVAAVKALGFDVTMSFLPPSAARPNSAKLAAKEDFYMVHLPMEAQNFSAEEPNTLRVSSSQKQVSSRVRDIKNMFPKVKYINNHTGSKYTEDERAMNRLILALNSNNISFVDSRTTSKTQVPKVMKNFALKYVARDVFLDHHMEKSYVKKQIKEAIRIAKSEGIAIAIGHPHKNTIAALKESRSLFKDIDLVLINKVY